LRKDDLVPGGVYAFGAYSEAALLLTTKLVTQTFGRHDGGRYEIAVGREVRVYKAKSRFLSSGTRQTGYLVLRGVGEELEQVDRQAVLDAVLATGKVPGGTVGRLDLLFSLTPLKGPWREVREQREAERDRARMIDNARTRRYNEAVTRLNQYLEPMDQRRTYAETGNVWGQSQPSFTFSLPQMEAFLDGIEEKTRERVGRAIVDAVRD
jgi:hypothetical protein